MARCPHCGCPAIPDVATHVAFTEACAADQLRRVIFAGDDHEED